MSGHNFLAVWKNKKCTSILSPESPAILPPWHQVKSSIWKPLSAATQSPGTHSNVKTFFINLDLQFLNAIKCNFYSMFNTHTPSSKAHLVIYEDFSFINKPLWYIYLLYSFFDKFQFIGFRFHTKRWVSDICLVSVCFCSPPTVSNQDTSMGCRS